MVSFENDQTWVKCVPSIARTLWLLADQRAVEVVAIGGSCPAMQVGP